MAKLFAIVFLALAAGVAMANSAEIETRRVIVFEYNGTKYILGNAMRCPKELEGQWYSKADRSCRCKKTLFFGRPIFSFEKCKRVPTSTTTTPFPTTVPSADLSTTAGGPVDGTTTTGPVAPTDPTTVAPPAP